VECSDSFSIVLVIILVLVLGRFRVLRAKLSLLAFTFFWVTSQTSATPKAPAQSELRPTCAGTRREWFLSRRDSTIVARHEVPG
jgi:hypothetical protein